MRGFYGVRGLGVEGFRGEVGFAFSCVFGVWGIVIGVEDAGFWRSDLLQELSRHHLTAYCLRGCVREAPR